MAIEQDISAQPTNSCSPSVLYITGGIIGGMGLIPSVLNKMFLLLGGGLAGIAYTINK